MNHDIFQQRLSEFFDGELDSKQTELWRRHVESCAECRSEIAEMERLSKTLEHSLQIPLTPRFSARVMAAVKRSEPQLQPRSAGYESFAAWFSLPRWELAVFAGVFFLAGSYFTLDYLRPPAQAVTQLTASAKSDDALKILLDHNAIDQITKEVSLDE